MVRCPVCKEQNPDQARFCSNCGNPLPTGRTGTRKTVTIMFIDIAGWTNIGESIDSEPLQQVKWRFFSTVSGVIKRHGGSVEKFIGDAVFGVFGIPVVHEDDALRAVRAAFDIRVAMGRLNDELRREWGLTLRIRTGINTGEVAVAGGTVTGDAVNVASRLEEAAAPDEILIGDSTYRMIRHSVTVDTIPPLVVQGKRDPLRAHRLIGLVDPSAGPGSRTPSLSLAAPVIGRNRERRRIQDAFEAVVEERICHLFTVLGPAGIGKSRMVKEFCDGVANRATVLSGRCLSYGEGIAYWPLMEMVRQATGMSADSPALEGRRRLRELLDELGVAGATEVVAALAPLVGLGGAEVGTQESFWAVRTLFQALAERRPLVLCFDDVHWAEPTLLDLIEHITDWSRDAPILLLCLTRPDLLEERRQWGGGKLNATSMLLQPLTDERCQRLIRSLMGSDDVPPALIDRITSSAAGNPLFVEQMVAALVDDGLLRRDGNGWTATGNLRDVKVPPSISALLAARLDRLDAAERRVLERAAVVGGRFYLDAVVDLSDPEERPHVASHCLALVRKELVHPDRSDLPGVEAFRFLHVLLRDCAYQATSKRQRADLHERFARWLQARMLGGPGEHDELVGYHLEQAYRYRVELGQRDATTVELGRQAASCLIEAADRVRQGDEMGAAQLLKRAIVLLPELDPLRLRAEIDLGWALYSFGRLSDADRILRQVTERARRGGEEGLRAHARLAHLRVQFATEPEGLVAVTLEEAGQALAAFVHEGDEVGAALAARSRASAYIAAGQFTAAEKAMRLAVQHAEDSGVPRASQSLRRELVSLLSWTPRPVEESISLALAALAEAGDDRGQRRALLAQLAVLTAMGGDLEAARTHLKDAEEIVWDLSGPRFDPLHSGFVVARVAVLGDDLATAERELLKSCRHLSKMGEKVFLATRAAALAEVMLALGRLDDAGKYVTRCRDAAAGDQLPAQAGWCGVHARLLAIRGRDNEALRFAETAVELAGKTDDLDGQAAALLARAEVLHRRGRKDDAAESLAAALERYHRKGNVTAAALATRAFDRLDDDGPDTTIIMPPEI
ncbi:AAA family ATPase [Frankia sp. CNm7]|uniref:AAA family ATPase n=1 Tax=Frankia nepalensis TaxID=1836974 RepID=A0A937R9A6_9ACTN|nr:adenylate/guanylate cyclase domain-containing protein [Frankia nepalensis]MBL7495340.1 AAA family ATPase [Frankia nepalensis]MBL7513290.1 AAA family ATPase [Frankia nepalensis]MBL7524473.1 AAA family ATPase [Frankia nepalensis]MBL7627771.1 AAA family ATPase [Frankia nepalensis]